jgi:hypothetical protein
MTYVKAADAAFASNIPPGFQVVFGYYGGPNAFHVWSKADWDLFPGSKVPIWVGGYDGKGEGVQAAQALRELGVPTGSYTVLDMETRKDDTYVNHFADALNAAGYRVWVYGSASTVFANPQRNGYFVADYVANPLPVLQQVGVRAVQYLPDVRPGYDESLVKEWTVAGMWGSTA